MFNVACFNTVIYESPIEFVTQKTLPFHPPSCLHDADAILLSSNPFHPRTDQSCFASNQLGCLLVLSFVVCTRRPAFQFSSHSLDGSRAVILPQLLQPTPGLRPSLYPRPLHTYDGTKCIFSHLKLFRILLA